MIWLVGGFKNFQNVFGVPKNVMMIPFMELAESIMFSETAWV